jgi:hypothetical protein
MNVFVTLPEKYTYFIYAVNSIFYFLKMNVFVTVPEKYTYFIYAVNSIFYFPADETITRLYRLFVTAPC